MKYNDAGYWLLDAGYWMLVTGCWLLDAGCWMNVFCQFYKTEQSDSLLQYSIFDILFSPQ
jgi:hypothetical protein